ncbi:DUF5683 domain-containing protein [Dyadobacter sp. CY312]|uniref:DUF5683 domain-containing protein n=1 Tax=Dyadobacter sp. CY312 TaxID=2907303 RepID=UPI001F341DF0|nr:DUF5683 domain-containing protein [Dyadobacter sp. CY312]MCE7042426.1 DUF5683 domain-containing protein [Dyadobacter sp. CY312]
MKIWWLMLMLISVKGMGQDVLLNKKAAMSEVVKSSDSVAAVEKNQKFSPDPRRAVRLALIPGMGQTYNRDYWKLPIVYLSLAGGIYSWHLNNLKYQDFLSSYIEFYDMDEASKTYGAMKPGMAGATVPVRIRNLFNTESEYRNLTRDMIARNKDYWRRNRNLSIIVTGLIYSLSIIEANVAAHLKTFDLSDDISLRIEPKLSQPMVKQPAPGIRLVFNLK